MNQPAPIATLGIVCRCPLDNELTTTETGIRVLRRVHAAGCDLEQYIATHDVTIRNTLKTGVR